jgi:hypothetical protein
LDIYKSYSLIVVQYAIEFFSCRATIRRMVTEGFGPPRSTPDMILGNLRGVTYDFSPYVAALRQGRFLTSPEFAQYQVLAKQNVHLLSEAIQLRDAGLMRLQLDVEKGEKEKLHPLSRNIAVVHAMDADDPNSSAQIVLPLHEIPRYSKIRDAIQAIEVIDSNFTSSPEHNLQSYIVRTCREAHDVRNAIYQAMRSANLSRDQERDFLYDVYFHLVAERLLQLRVDGKVTAEEIGVNLLLATSPDQKDLINVSVSLTERVHPFDFAIPTPNNLMNQEHGKKLRDLLLGLNNKFDHTLQRRTEHTRR